MGDDVISREDKEEHKREYGEMIDSDEEVEMIGEAGGEEEEEEEEVRKYSTFSRFPETSETSGDSLKCLADLSYNIVGTRALHSSQEVEE